MKIVEESQLLIASGTFLGARINGSRFEERKIPEPGWDVLILHVLVKLGSEHTFRCDISIKKMMFLSPGWRDGACSERF